MTFNIDDYITTQTSPQLKWINIVGYEKAGKTKTLMELSKHLNTLYVDFDIVAGTKPYTGKVLRVGQPSHLPGERNISVVDFITQVIPEMKNMNKQILILDPVNEFVELVREQLMTQFGIDDLKNYRLAGVGNGWTVLYSKIQDYFQEFFAAFPIVITVTHLKLDKYFAGDVAAIQGAQLDLVGKIQQYVQRNADAHLVFTSKKDEHGKWMSVINEENSTSMIQVPLGCRDFAFLKRVTTGDDLIREIGLMFNKEIIIQNDQPLQEIKL